MTAADLPTLNACLNTLSAAFLILGFVRIKGGDQRGHKRAMVAALATSALFLCSYLIYHYLVGSVPYPHHNWTRPLYFAVLIPHIILAAGIVPFVFAAVWFAWRGNFISHRRITRWLWPAWMFVSISGVLIYLMLYRL